MLSNRIEPAKAGARTSGELDGAAMALVVLLCATWGSNQVAIKIANAGISPVLQVGLRSLGSGLLLLLWCRVRGIALTGRDGTLLPGLVAGLLFASEFALIYWGLQYTNISRSVLFVYTAPFVVALGAHVFVPGDRLTAGKVAGLLLAFGGLIAIFADGLFLPSKRHLIGDAMCLVGAVMWGATTVLIKASRLAAATAEKTLFYQLGVSAVVLPPVSVLFGEPGVFAPTGAVMTALAYQIVVIAFISYVAWFWLITKYAASRLAAFTFFTPAFGVAFGGILGEPIGPALLAGMVLIGLGIYLVNRPSPT